MNKTLQIVALLLVCWIPEVVAQPVLYGVGRLEGEENSRLLIADLADGSVQTVGEPLQYSCWNLAYGPAGLFALCYDEENRSVLAQIDPQTAETDVKGPAEHIIDITFCSDGRLFGWEDVFSRSVNCSVMSGGRVVLIDTGDGEATPLGSSGLDACSLGLGSTRLAFDAADRLYMVNAAWGFGIIDQATGRFHRLAQQGIGTDDLAFHPLTGELFISDDFPQRIRIYEISTGQFRDVAVLSTVLYGFAWSPQPSLIVPNLVSSPSTGSSRFRSFLTLMNRSSTVLEPSFEFFDNSGRSVGSNSSQIPDIAPQGTAHSSVFGPGEGLFNGWAQVSWEASANVQAAAEVALLTQPGEDGEPSIPPGVPLPYPSTAIVTAVQSALLPQSHSFTAAAVITPFRESAFAIVNPSASESALVEVKALSGDGQPFDGNEVLIPPRGRVSLMLFELLTLNKEFLLPPERPQDFAGSVQIRSDLPIAVTGLTVLLPDGKWTGLPVEAGREF